MLLSEPKKLAQPKSAPLVRVDIHRAASSSSVYLDVVSGKSLAAKQEAGAQSSLTGCKAQVDVAELQNMPSQQAPSQTQERLSKLATTLGMQSSVFKRVAPGYYDCAYEQRASQLGTCVEALCKSMVMENTRLNGDESCAERIKYVLVVLQYAGHKLDRSKLTDAVRGLEGNNALGRKQYNMRMVEEETSRRLSGYEHNAVTPLGMTTPMPIIISSSIASLDTIWLGAGEVDLKLGLKVDEFVSGMRKVPGVSSVSFADVVS